MQAYSATLETSTYLFDDMPNDYIEYGLVSFYHLKEADLPVILQKTKRLLIDSGAFTFRSKTKSGGIEDFDNFANKYTEFVKRWKDNERIEGFFELDIDGVVPYEKVQEYRKNLLKVTPKIIPVWHKNRGIQSFHNMCKVFKDRKVAITSLANDIAEDQYNMFINTAKKYGAKIHILGMTRFKYMKPFNIKKDDSCDSSSWKMTSINGGFMAPLPDGDWFKFSFTEQSDIHYKPLMRLNLITMVNIQRYYKGKEY